MIDETRHARNQFRSFIGVTLRLDRILPKEYDREVISHSRSALIGRQSIGAMK